MKTTLIILMLGIILSCQNNNRSEQANNDSSREAIFRENIKQDSLRLVEQERLTDELKELENMGALGKWRCDFSGYESEIILFKNQDDNQLFSQIDFTKSNMKTKTELLKQQGDLFLVVDSKVKEYYKILDDGNLELGDQKGLFSKAVNIMPGADVNELPPLNIAETIGQDIFYIAGSYSKSFPKTLAGTNSKEWKVYYEDINVIFTVDKSTDKIVSATYKDE